MRREGRRFQHPLQHPQRRFLIMPLAINHLLSLGFMAGTTGLEPATSAVTGQRSNQLSYVPRLFFNNLVICHIESESSQFSLLSLCSTISLLWTQIRAFLDTMWTPNWTPKVPVQRQRQVYQMGKEFRRLISAQGQTFIFGCWSQIVWTRFLGSQMRLARGTKPGSSGDSVLDFHPAQ